MNPPTVSASHVADIAHIAEQARPTFTNNTDPFIWDYMFFTSLEAQAKKARAASLDKLKEMSEDASQEGCVLMGDRLALELTLSKPRRTFDKSKAINLLLEAFPDLKRHKVVEIFEDAYTEGAPARSYKGVVTDVPS